MARCSTATTAAVRPRRASDLLLTCADAAAAATLRRERPGRASRVRSAAEAALSDRRVQLSQRAVAPIAERAGSDRLAAQVREDEAVRVEPPRAYLAQGRAEHRV